METIGGHSIQNIIPYVLIAIGVIAAIIILLKVFSKKEANIYKRWPARCVAGMGR